MWSAATPVAAVVCAIRRWRCGDETAATALPNSNVRDAQITVMVFSREDGQFFAQTAGRPGTAERVSPCRQLVMQRPFIDIERILEMVRDSLLPALALLRGADGVTQDHIRDAQMVAR